MWHSGSILNGWCVHPTMSGLLEKIGQGRVSDGLILSNVPAEATRCDL